MPRHQILCTKWGTRYGPEYVNILYAMVARNITDDFDFFCLTDDTSDVRREVQCLPLPDLGCEIPPDVRGKWRKQALWGRDLSALQGVALFLDLDVVIVSNIDAYFEHGQPDDVIVARNPMRPAGRNGQTSVFRFRIGSHAYLLENLRSNPAGISRKYQMEQDYVTACIRGGVKFWPDAWTRHFRAHSLAKWPLRYFRAPVLPRGAKIVIFPGHLKPPDAIVGQWSATKGPHSLGQHLRWVWANSWPPTKVPNRLRSFNLPAPWVAEHWRE